MFNFFATRKFLSCPESRKQVLKLFRNFSNFLS